MTKAIVLAGLVLLLAGGARGQATPDLNAYRKFFRAITDDTLTDRETAHLKGAGVVNNETQAVHVVLKDFKDHYAVLMDNYANSPNTLAGNNVDTNAFLVQLDRLVQQTIDQLKAKAPLSYPDFDARVNKVMDLNNKIKAKLLETQPVATMPMHHEMLGGGMDMGLPEPMPQGGGMTPQYDSYQTESMDSNPLLSPMWLQASMFSSGNAQGGAAHFTTWNPANLVDGNEGTVGIAGGQALDFFTVDAGVGQTIDTPQIGFYMLGAGCAESWTIQYSDVNNGWHDTGARFTPSGNGWNYSLMWNPIGPHRYWIFELTTASCSATINQLTVMVFNPHTMYTTNLLEGYTSGCNGGYPCSVAKHQGHVTNKLNGVGYTVDGNKVSPPTWISVPNYQNYTFPPQCFDPSDSPECIAVTASEASEEDCSINGVFAQFTTTFPLVILPAFTGVFWDGLPGTPYPLTDYPATKKYGQLNGCSIETSPPDMPISAILELDGGPSPHSSVGWGECLYALGFPIACSPKFAQLTSAAGLFPWPGAITWYSTAPICDCTKAASGVYGFNCWGVGLP